jgi:hypothetical protein
MNVLKRALYIQAGLWALIGVALASAPGFVLVTVFRQPPFYDLAWLRILGLQTFCVGLLMVLVAHRIQELWWWSWAFELVNVLLVAVVVLNAAIGRAPGESAVLWWLFTAVALSLAFNLLWGLFVSSREQPLP